MDVKATLVIRKIEVNLEGDGSVLATASFKIGNMPLGVAGAGMKFTVPLTSELRKYIESVVVEQVGEIISNEKEVE